MKRHISILMFLLGAFAAVRPARAENFYLFSNYESTFTDCYGKGSPLEEKVELPTQPKLWSIFDGYSIAADAKDGYRFTGWYTKKSGWTGTATADTVDETPFVKTAEITYAQILTAGTSDENKLPTIVAKYVPIYTVTTAVSPSGTGAVSLDPADGTYEEGSTVKLTASPTSGTSDSGYHFVRWADGVTDAVRTIENLSANVSLTAEFTANGYGVTKSAENAVITVDSTGTYDRDILVSWSPESADGYNYEFVSARILTGTETLTNFTAGTSGVFNMKADVGKYSSAVIVEVKYTRTPVVTGYQLTIDPNGGKFRGMEGDFTFPNRLQYGEKTLNQIDVATGGPGVFLGYFTSNGQPVYDAEGKNIACDYWTAPWPDGAFQGNASLRLEARWGEALLIAVAAEPSAAGQVSGGGYYLEGTDVTLEAVVTNAGYSFCCWTNETGFATNTNPWTFKATEDAAYLALFTGNVYTVSLRNTGKLKAPTVSVTFGKPYGVFPTYTDDELVLAGWFTEEDGKGTQIHPSTIVTTAQDHSLYAYWVDKETYTVHFDGNGATSGSMSDQTVIRDVSTPLAPNGFRRTGHTFLGWATEKGGGKVYDDQAKVTNLAAAGQTATLYAVWQANAYTVRFNANGGEGEMDDQPFIYDVAEALANNVFTKEKSSFAGWAKSPSGVFLFGDGETVSNLTAVADATVTLYAKWEKPTLTNELSIAADCEREYGDGRQPLELTTANSEWCMVQEGQDAGGNGKYVRLAPSDNNAAVLVSESISGTGRLTFSYRTSINPGAEAHGSYLTLWTNGLPCEDFKITATSDRWVDYVYEKTSEEPVEVRWVFTGQFCETLGDYALVDYIRWIPDGAGPTYAEDDTPVTGFSMSDGQIGFSFAADGSSTYHILGTNDVTAPWPWPFVREVGAGETQPVRIDIKADEPKMFYRIRALIP